jgi:cytochrome c-type biogenesis protein
MDNVREDIRYGGLVAATVAFGVAGYGAYLLYPRFDLPLVDAVGLAVLALAAGVAAFFSPCSFPLLATLLVRETRGGGNSADSRRIVLGRALTYAAALAVGTAVFLTLVASVIAAGGQALVESVTFTSPAGRIIRLGIGALLIVLGLIQLGAVRFPFHRVAALAQPLLRSQAATRRRWRVAGFVIFGFGYLVAGFG